MSDTDKNKDRFDLHEITKLEGNSWLCKRPETTDDHFVVTWIPTGHIVITGDLGRMIFSRESPPTIHGAFGLARSSHNYLCEKSLWQREYSHDATLAGVIEEAHDYLNEEDDEWLWEEIAWITRHDDGHDKRERPEILRDLIEKAKKGVTPFDLDFIIGGDADHHREDWPKESHAICAALWWWASNMTVDLVYGRDTSGGNDG